MSKETSLKTYFVTPLWADNQILGYPRDMLGAGGDGKHEAGRDHGAGRLLRDRGLFDGGIHHSPL